MTETDETFLKYERLNGFDPRKVSGENLARLQERVAGLTEAEQNLLSRVSNRLYRNSEFRHQTDCEKACSELLSPAALRAKGQSRGLTASSGKNCEDELVFMTFGPEGHPCPKFNKNSYITITLPTAKFIEQKKIGRPLEHVVYGPPLLYMRSQFTYGIFVLGETKLMIKDIPDSQKTGEGVRRYIFIDDNGAKSTLEFKFKDLMTVNKDIIAMISNLFICLWRKLVLSQNKTLGLDSCINFG